MHRGARAITEDAPPLANAIRQVEEEAAARMAEVLAVLLPDTPLVTTPVLTEAVHTLGAVVIAPSLDESGTNLLLRRPPRAILARFGHDSYRKHLEEAAGSDVPTAVVELPGLGVRPGPSGRYPHRARRSPRRQDAAGLQRARPAGADLRSDVGRHTTRGRRRGSGNDQGVGRTRRGPARCSWTTGPRSASTLPRSRAPASGRCGSASV